MVVIGFLLLVSFALSVGIGLIVEFAADWFPVPNLLALAANVTLTLVVVTLLFATVYKGSGGDHHSVPRTPRHSV